MKIKKRAYVENILLWMIMFISFVTLFFIILDYSSVLRIKDNLTSLSDYGARMISLDKDDTTIVNGLNNLRIQKINAITAGNLLCVTDTGASNYQVIFHTQTTYNNSVFQEAGSNNLVSTSAVFNEASSDQVECTLSVTVTN